MKRACIILNETAGQATGIEQRLAPLVGRNQCEVCIRREGETVEVQARRAVDEGFERIIVAGGDGTLNHVVNGVAADLGRIEVGLIPLGTGNDFARSLELPLDRLDAAFSIALGDQVRAVDLIRITDGKSFYAVNAASGGMAGKVAADVLDVDKARWGAFAYWMTALSELIDMRASDLHLDIDDRPQDLQVYGVVIANGRYVGGGFPIAPKATLDDGKLTIVIIPVLPTLELLSAGLNYTLGSSPTMGQIKTFEATRIHLTAKPEMQFSIDGEPTREIEATFEVVPGALRMAVGTTLASSS
ncbi:MAG: diacylglycerol kinase family lipid kinase [Planctomycetota bacterium]|nr:diacylglycerol kinase family lipid kinase [Planctomycetota bacterium]